MRGKRYARLSRDLLEIGLGASHALPQLRAAAAHDLIDGLHVGSRVRASVQGGRGRATLVHRCLLHPDRRPLTIPRCPSMTPRPAHELTPRPARALTLRWLLSRCPLPRDGSGVDGYDAARRDQIMDVDHPRTLHRGRQIAGRTEALDRIGEECVCLGESVVAASL